METNNKVNLNDIKPLDALSCMINVAREMPLPYGEHIKIEQARLSILDVLQVNPEDSNN